MVYREMFDICPHGNREGVVCINMKFLPNVKLLAEIKKVIFELNHLVCQLQVNHVQKCSNSSISNDNLFCILILILIYEHSFESPTPVFRLVKTMYSRQNPGFAESSLKELAPLPCIARLRVRKETNQIQIVFRRSVWLVYGQVEDRYTLQPRYCNLYFVTMLPGHITVFSIKVAHKPYQT